MNGSNSIDYSRSLRSVTFPFMNSAWCAYFNVILIWTLRVTILLWHLILIFLILFYFIHSPKPHIFILNIIRWTCLFKNEYDQDWNSQSKKIVNDILIVFNLQLLTFVRRLENPIIVLNRLQLEIFNSRIRKHFSSKLLSIFRNLLD
jgi:hypothetical protein